MTWTAFLETNNKNGIIYASAESLPVQPDDKVKLIKLNTAYSIHDEGSLFNELFVMGDYFEFFGFNYNALIDVLTSEDRPDDSYIVYLFYHYKGFRESNTGTFRLFLETFAGARQHSKIELQSYDLALILVSPDAAQRVLAVGRGTPQGFRKVGEAPLPAHPLQPAVISISERGVLTVEDLVGGDTAIRTTGSRYLRRCCPDVHASTFLTAMIFL